MPRVAGSGLMTKKKSFKPHLLQGTGGVQGEVSDLRSDILAELNVEAAMAIEEFTNPAAASTTALLAATASTVAVQTYLKAGLLAAGIAVLADVPRNVTFTTGAAGTPADAPANAVIVGKDGEGKAQTETVALSQVNGTAAGVKAWSDITSITYAAGDGAGASISIGFGIVIGLRRTPKARTTATPLAIREIVDGAFVTTGALSATNKTYTPATAPDGAHDYAVYYEWDATTSLP